ncbi:hypothetical protein [uncultured Boseongicola sp.]|uniref:hypothetical protein n=1 Tax=uncultured Boseongicola sp. TaxID=1648499 RepID=UPI002612B6A2|nr:hypothetical protein [uncultured Boseongicola sp.]
MSKAGAGQNVEDMLSSVRRLVSDELPRMPRAEVPQGPAALVLTEAQRIEAPLIGHNSRRKSLEDRIAELEAAVADSSDDWEPDGSEDLEQHRPDHIVFKASRAVTRPPSTPLQLTEVSKSVGPAAVLPPAPEETSEPAPDPAPTRERFVSVVAAPPDVLGEETEADLQDQVETALTEAVTSAIVDMAQDALTGDDAFGQTLAEAVGAENDGVSDVAPQAESVDDAPPRARAARASFDGADIRPLISSLIREELQGDLGERITRNVRKLVRQEIQRALAVREVE